MFVGTNSRGRVRYLQLKNDSSTRNVAKWNGAIASRPEAHHDAIDSHPSTVVAPECCVLTPRFQRMADTWADPFVQLLRKNGRKINSHEAHKR
jgi:hypothetical protein